MRSIFMSGGGAQRRNVLERFVISVHSTTSLIALYLEQFSHLYVVINLDLLKKGICTNIAMIIKPMIEKASPKDLKKSGFTTIIIARKANTTTLALRKRTRNVRVHLGGDESIAVRFEPQCWHFLCSCCI